MPPISDLAPAPGPPRLRTLGLVGGIGPASTRLYYDLLVSESRRVHGVTPEIIIHSLDFDRFTWLEDHDRRGYVAEIRRSLRSLVLGGAEVLAMAANSPHAVFNQAILGVREPVVHIVGAVAREARRRGVSSALLLGIPATMTAPFYADVCQRVGLRIETPHARHHGDIRRIVFEELTAGVCSDASRARLLGLLADHDVDALILGCTELSLLIRPEHCPLPLLDSSRLHVGAILEILPPPAPTERTP